MFLQAGQREGQCEMNGESGNETIRIVVIDRQNLLRDRIRNMIRREPGLQ
jgi:hypothetical protein